MHSKAVDQTWTFSIKPKKLPKLRLVLVDGEDKPLAGKAWTLTAPKALTGTTKKDGLIEVRSSAAGNGWRSRSHLAETKAKSRRQLRQGSGDQEAHLPPAYQGERVHRRRPEAPTAADDVMQFTLNIGSLPPFSDDTACVHASTTSAYRCVPTRTPPRRRRAVKAFQRGRLKQKTPSGALADIRHRRADKHDTP